MPNIGFKSSNKVIKPNLLTTQKLDFPAFLLAGFIALIIAWSAIGFQALRAASVNPVDSLKNS